jgi:hypothetical protein
MYSSASVIEEDSDDIMNAMSASAWAGMMAEAVDEEERE